MFFRVYRNVRNFVPRDPRLEIIKEAGETERS